MNRVIVPPLTTPPVPPLVAAPVECRGETMGTTWSVRAFAPAGFPASRFMADIEALFADIIEQMSPWAPGSVINQFNDLPAGAWLELPAHFNTVLDCALKVAAQSDGAFDPTLAALIDLWGFGAQTPAREQPTDDEIATALSQSGWRKLQRDAAKLRQPCGLRLDLNGVAKGYAVDQLTALAKRAGLPSCLAEIGGELSGYGVKPDGQPWWVELEQPPGADTPRTLVALFDHTIATSGDYRRNTVVHGQVLSHTISPLTGRPIENGVASVSVLHKSCMWADAYASAITVLGAERGMQFADALDICATIVTHDAAGVREALSARARDWIDQF
jgi:FAD:protein FMN transferase